MSEGKVVRVAPNPARRDHRLTDKRRPRNTVDGRSEARRDRDRVIYSQAWRRLGGVTQVITPFDDITLLHNRLTHSQKVAQVARSVAEQLLNDVSNHELLQDLGGLDADAAEAAGLAHDLGHAPFGHVGEETLDEVAREELDLHEGFEGNAQTVRAVLVTENRHPNYDGLDLTCATIAGIAKYPWQRTDKLDGDRHEEALENDPQYRKHWKKFNAYAPEKPVLDRARELVLDDVDLPRDFTDETQTVEASVMDLADDITYAVHDLEDFYLAGILDVRAVLDGLRAHARDNRGEVASSKLKDLQARLARDYEGWFHEDEFREAVRALYTDFDLALFPDFENAPHQIAHARKKGSDLIGRYLSAVELLEQPAWPGGPFVMIGQQEWHQVQILKEVTRRFVIERPDIALLQRGQQRILRDLIEMMSEWSQSDKDFKRLPRRLRAEIETARSQQGTPTPSADERYIKSGSRPLADSRPFAPRGHPDRCLIDFVCSLTDGQCLALFNKLSGRRLARSSMDVFV